MRNFLRGQYGPLRVAAGEGGEGGGGDPPAFDAAAFEAKVLDGVNKAINGFGKKFETALAALKPPGDPPADPPADPPPGGKPNPDLAKALAKIEALTKRVTESDEKSAKTEAAAREKERLSLVRTELAKHGLADHSVDDAFRFFRDEVKFNEAGELVGGDDVPLADFVKATVEKRKHWLPPAPAGGAGAGNGKGGGKGKAPDTDDIKPGMTVESTAAIKAHLAATLRGQ